MKKLTLEERMLSKTCRKLPCDASAQDRKDYHKVKMGKKKILRDRFIPDPEHIFANISKNHPDYGMTPREHADAKRNRK